MNYALEIRGLTHAYGDRRVLDRADLALAPGDFMALIGPNGSGKTTLLKCLAGILVPDAGHVLIDGVDLRDDRLAATRRLGFAVDPVLLPGPLTGRQCLQLFATTRELPGVPDSTHALANALAFAPWLDVEVERYSLGTRQKLGILLGLLGEPPVLVLDEPMNGLDPISAYALKQHLVELTQRGTAVLLATHALDVAERFITRAALLIDGRIARHWLAADLAAIRSDATRSLEQAMVEALRGTADARA